MAVLNGQITDLAIAGKDLNPNISSDLDGYDDILNVWNSPYAQKREPALSQQRAFNAAPINERALSGSIAHHYKEDYYHRIHVAPNPLALGNLLSEETRQAYVWNAFFENKTLDTVTKENADGIRVTEPEAAPVDYAPLEEKAYTIAVSLSGPPTIDADINFAFAVYTVTLNITGSRVTLWRWIPREQYTEILAWNTQVLQTRVGEQRIGYRAAPRQVFEFRFFRPAREISQMKNVVDNWSHRVWGLPIWKEASVVSATAGATAISFDTSYRDYRQDSLAVLWESADKAEAVNVTNVRPDGIDIDPALQTNFADAFVMPLRRALTPEGVDFRRGRAPDYAGVSATFIVIDNEDLSGSADYPQYDGYDILDDGNIIVGDMAERISIPLEQIDNGQGPITIETKQDYSRVKRTVGKYTKTLAALWQWRRWLHSRYGRQKAFWLPAYNRDIHLATPLYSAEVQAEIRPADLAVHGNFPVDCMIRLADATIFYRQITGAEQLPGGNERIIIDSAFGQDIDPTDIDLWCYMDLVRFDADRIEMAHQNPYIMQTSIPAARVPE
ncbi:hypothetical protein HNR65_002170 [Desulfosalsimonas propionicica]|uniref:Virion structural protein n=1 Tax=Desulfosalsimonas propionicica TaxID=332175 RepID=A0A7W0HL17_9BACT|nr:hypothetical protein [Desulfosalsimonas propionicica]MBA2881839.1 hypothetical protein [Desulfosalsimonas propionicica]